MLYPTKHEGTAGLLWRSVHMRTSKLIWTRSSKPVHNNLQKLRSPWKIPSPILNDIHVGVKGCPVHSVVEILEEISCSCAVSFTWKMHPAVSVHLVLYEEWSKSYRRNGIFVCASLWTVHRAKTCQWFYVSILWLFFSHLLLEFDAHLFRISSAGTLMWSLLQWQQYLQNNYTSIKKILEIHP